MLIFFGYWYVSLSLWFFRFLILERIEPLTAASTAVPSLTTEGGRAPAPSRPLCAAYPARLCYHDLFRAGSGARNNTVDLHPAAGELAFSSKVGLGLQDASDVPVGGSCQMDGVVGAPHTHPSRTGFCWQLISSSEGRDSAKGVKGQAGLLALCGDDVVAACGRRLQDVLEVSVLEIADVSAVVTGVSAVVTVVSAVVTVWVLLLQKWVLLSLN